MGKLDGKVALITGSASGIGRAAALLFAGEGAAVAVADLAAAGGQETADMIRKAGGKAAFIPADVTRAAEVEAMARSAVEAFGRVDILYNNAGLEGAIGEVVDLPEKDWETVINVNLRSVFLCSKFTIPYMIRQGGGSVISTSSVMALSGKAKMAAYCVSKAGVITITKCMATEYATRNVRANCICPGLIDTPLSARSINSIQLEYIPEGKPGRPEDIARAALYLASDDSAYVTGTALVVDGGWTAALIVPRK